MSDERSLEPDARQRAAWLEQFGGFALAQLDALSSAPAVGIVGAAGNAIARELSAPIPEGPLPGGAAEILARLERAVTASLNAPGPGYMAYVPGGGLYATALADLISNCVNRYTGQSSAAPALCQLEDDVLRWLASSFGYDYDDGARGLLTTGGSMANFSAIAAARHARFGDSGDYSRALAYVSTQSHHCVAKSLRLAGIPIKNVRVIATDAAFRMDPEALARQVRADRAAGGEPFLVVAAAGTTNTGAIDPMPALAELCGRERLWLHVDAAYGGAFVLCDEGRRRLAGIARAESIAFDPHKGMFLPYGTGCLLVRDGAALRAVHHVGADYLQDFDAHDRRGEPPNPAEYGPELSRGFRGLRLWLPLMLHGAGAFRRALAEKLALAERAHEGLSRRIEAGAPLELVARPQLSALAFRLARAPGESLASWGARNTALLDAINRRARVFLSSTNLPTHERDGQVLTLRVCVLSFRSHARHIDQLLEDLDAALLETRAADRA